MAQTAPTEIATTFLDSLLTEFGIWEHSDGEHPLREEGYSLDDAARGLMLYLLLGRHAEANILFDFIDRSVTDDAVVGFYRADGSVEGYASEDAIGEAIWALGLAYRKSFRPDDAERLLSALREVQPVSEYIRPLAYMLLGALHWEPFWADSLAGELLNKWWGTSQHWFWPEEQLTYANGIMPYALLRHAGLHGDYLSRVVGLEILDFVDRCSRIDSRVAAPIGNHGWMDRVSRATYGQQPIDAAYMHWAHTAAHELVHQDSTTPVYLLGARDWLAWFGGRNTLGVPMVDATTNKCFDGLEEHGPNTRSGAEANICYLLSLVLDQTGQLF